MNVTGEIAWSRYWERGFLTTFSGETNENYTGLIKDFWFSEFEKLKPNSTILDCCSGNGAILALAKAFMLNRGVNYNLIAVDYADVKKSSDFFSKNNDIQVYGQTSVEDMPLDMNTVDLCVSQFGVEYTNFDASVSEIARVLKPSGRFCALIHHANSNISASSSLSLGQIEYCSKSNLPDIVLKLLSRLDQLKKEGAPHRGDSVSEKLREDYNVEARNIMTHAQYLSESHHINYFLGELSGVFSARAKNLTYAQKKEIIKNIKGESKLYENRMRAMVEAGQDCDGVSNLKSKLVACEFDVESVDEMRVGLQVAAWAIKSSLLRN